jgi:hypothetical protein
MTHTPWRFTADEMATCNCAWGCPCQFNALPTHGRCEALVALRIREGHYGQTRLDGLAFASAYWWPGAIHEGNGISQLAIDERATPDQRAALVEINSGRQGGTMFEIFASVTPTMLDPIFAPIHFESDQERRVGKLDVPGLGQFRAEPIRNPVTGEEHRARIDLPNGFEYKLAEMANCVENRAKVGEKLIANTNCYAQFCSVDWTNA